MIMARRKPRAITGRQLTPIKRRLQTLERHRISARADITKLQVDIYDLTSRLCDLERQARESNRS